MQEGLIMGGAQLSCKGIKHVKCTCLCTGHADGQADRPTLPSLSTKLPQHRTSQQQKSGKAAAEGSATQQVTGQQQCINQQQSYGQASWVFHLCKAYLHGNNCSLHLPVGMLSLHTPPQVEPPLGQTPHWSPHTNLLNSSWASVTGVAILFLERSAINVHLGFCLTDQCAQTVESSIVCSTMSCKCACAS